MERGRGAVCVIGDGRERNSMGDCCVDVRTWCLQTGVDVEFPNLGRQRTLDLMGVLLGGCRGCVWIGAICLNGNWSRTKRSERE